MCSIVNSHTLDAILPVSRTSPLPNLSTLCILHDLVVILNNRSHGIVIACVQITLILLYNGYKCTIIIILAILVLITVRFLLFPTYKLRFISEIYIGMSEWMIWYHLQFQTSTGGLVIHCLWLRERRYQILMDINIKVL